VSQALDDRTVDAAERETLKQRAIVLAYQALAVVARTLPEKTGRAIFSRAGRMVFRFAHRARAVVLVNQAQVLGRSVDDPLVRDSAEEAFALYARYWVDSFHLTKLSDAELLARVRCDTGDRLRDPVAAGTGAIAVMPHMGNWDVGGRWVKAIGLPVVTVVEELEPRRLYELFLAHRRSLGIEIIGLSDSNVGSRLAGALGANRVVALVADRDFSGRGIDVEMFGRIRRLPAGPALLSITTGAPLMATPVYTTPQGWRIEISEPITVEPTGDRRADVRALTVKMALAFEEAISAAPSDWHMFQPGWEP
jgi:KDO2-lipid IV(A) lauroyltransferase